MSKRLSFAPLAAAIGLGFSLIAGRLVAPTVAHAEGEIRIAEQFGIGYLLLNVVRDQNLIDKYTIAVPHPDATAALVAGGTELSGHFSTPPFHDQELENPNLHVVLNSYDVLGPNSPTVLFATEKFRNENPKTYKAFIEALTEAAQFAQNDKGAAADTYIRVTKAKIDRAALLTIIDNPQFEFSVTPKNTYPLAEFLYRVGAIKNKPDSWKDYFFQDAKPLQGS